ncbi:MAG: hypothetical protein JNJ54_07365 [Myxococcaceae bacterium]|nr:hypothetical protein [Myxococcaceae bacterium]
MTRLPSSAPSGTLDEMTMARRSGLRRLVSMRLSSLSNAIRTTASQATQAVEQAATQPAPVPSQPTSPVDVFVGARGAREPGSAGGWVGASASHHTGGVDLQGQAAASGAVGLALRLSRAGIQAGVAEAVKVGLEGRASLSSGPFSLAATGFLGASQRLALSGGLGDGHASMGGAAEAFVGLRGGVEGRFDHALAGVGLGGEVLVGFGAETALHVGARDGELSVGGKVGAAFVVGAAVEGDARVNVPRLIRG